MVIEAQRALQLVPSDLHIVRAQGRMLGARLRQLAACALHIALLLVNYGKLEFRFVPERIGLGSGVLDRGPSLVGFLPVALGLRATSKSRVRIGRRRVRLYDLFEDLVRFVVIAYGVKGLGVDRQRTSEIL